MTFPHPPLATPGCGDCSKQSPLMTWKQVLDITRMLVQGHQALATLYQSFAASFPEERGAFKRAAEKHQGLADLTNQVTVPDSFEDPVQSDLAKLGGSTLPEGPEGPPTWSV